MVPREKVLPLLIAAAAAGPTQVAWGGMPSVTLSDFGRMRLEGISFFLGGLLVSAGLIQWVWNSLQKDFTRLPRLTYGKACCVVVLWGLLFVVVLTMISGARELMTPGAWVKKGVTYQLRSAAESTESKPETAGRDEELVARRQQLVQLGQFLRAYAQSHDGKFPATDTVSEIPPQNWQTPDPSGMRYVYVPGLSWSDAGKPLAYEPTIFVGDPLVLLTDGEVMPMALDEIRLARSGDVR